MPTRSNRHFIAIAMTAALAVPTAALAAKHVHRRVAIAPQVIDAPHDARREGNRICFSDHFHYGSGGGQNQRAAQISAIGSWQSFVDFEYGSAWSNFAKAGSKKFSCSGPAGAIECSLEARPCR